MIIIIRDVRPAPPRPVKITKTCGAQRGKVDFNPLKFGRLLQIMIQFCPINICLTHKSVHLRTFLPRPAPQTFTLTPVCPVNPWFTHLGKLSQIKPFFPLFWHYSGQASRASFMRWVDKTTFRIFCAAAPDLTSPQARSHLNFRIDSLQVFQWSTKMDKSCVGAEVLNYCCSKWKESTSAISDQICFKPLA